MNRIRKNDKGVSPVIATILMVAITVVLAGVLVVYLQTLPSGAGAVDTQLGLRTEKVATGWLISITGGKQAATDVTYLETNPGTGVRVQTWAVSALAVADGTFNDANANGKIEPGDSILVLNVAAGGRAVAGDKVQFLKGESVIGVIKELPS